MMAFTDDDFKSIEKELAYIEEPETEFVSYTAIFISALLARLDAAEKVCNSWPDAPIMQEAIKVWRKACGVK